MNPCGLEAGKHAVAVLAALAVAHYAFVPLPCAAALSCPLNSSTLKLQFWMQFEEEEGGIGVAILFGDDNEMRQNCGF